MEPAAFRSCALLLDMAALKATAHTTDALQETHAAQSMAQEHNKTVALPEAKQKPTPVPKTI